MPKISVILPVYNKAKYLQATLDSIFAQTFTDFEIIAVNDGSTDASLNILESNQDSRLLIYNQENNGLSAARNAGITAVSSEIIALIDADDLWLPDHLETLFGLSQNDPNASTFGTSYKELFSNGNLVEPAVSFETLEACEIPDFFEANMMQPLVIPSSFAFKKWVFKAIGGFDESVTYSEDVDFYIRVHLQFTMAYSPKMTCHYRMNSENQITKQRKTDLNPPDFEKFLLENPEHKSLHRYINLKRYFLCNFYKLEKNWEGLEQLRSKIDTSQLSKKQRFLLSAPRGVLLALSQIKKHLLKNGKRVTAF